MITWRFTFDGIQGLAEQHGETVFISWGGMGFHIEAAMPDLFHAIMSAKHGV